MLECAICGKKFSNDNLNEYAAHVQKCAEKESLKRKTEDMKKINQELEEVKRAKTVYEGLKNSFKEKHPDIYKANFSDYDTEKCKCNKNTKNDTYEFTYDIDDFEDLIATLFGYKYSNRNN